jgi:uncharacterized protein (TIGR02231 family)
MRIIGLIAAACLFGAPAALAEEITAPSKIDAVTVFPSGAEVTRTINVKLKAGEHSLLIGDVTGEAVAASIRVEASATGKLEIGSVDARRISLSSSDPAVAQSSRKKIEDQIQTLNDTNAAQDAVIQAAEMQQGYLENLAKLPQTPAAGGGAAPKEDWNALFGVIGSGMGEVSKTIAAAKLKQREISRQIEDLNKQLAAAGGKFEDRTEVRIYVSAAEALDASLTLRYQVQSASWSPFYDARLATGDKEKGASPTLALTRRASVLQTTGEDWDGVSLSLSTARAGASTAAPQLAMLSVDFGRLAPAGSPYSNSDASPVMYKQAMAPQQQMQTEAFDGLDNRKLEENQAPAKRALGRAPEKPAYAAVTAFQAVYGIPGRTVIKSTGEAKRLQIMSEDTEPSLMVQTAPRIDHTAYLYARFTLPKASSPLLQGQVSLFRDGVFVGTGQLPQLSPGEDYDLGFGSDERVKVKRAVLEDKKGETGTFSTSQVEERRYQITVKNLHTRSVQVQVLDRIPIAMRDDIKVEFSMDKGPQPDEKDVNDKRGVMLWKIGAEPGEEKQIAFGCRVTAPATLPLLYKEIADEEFRATMRMKK